MANADRIIELLHEAKARPAGAERARFLDESCRDDSALKEQILSLLQVDADEGESDFLKSIPINRQTILVTEKPGDRIGRYKLLEQIGEGGCGVVYMAEQEEPVRRRVALKVIKLGMDTKQVIARFEAERQALAMMDHPNIAKVLDGGATDTGRPFFVMELVRGIKITDYCDQNNLSTKERLELFIQVCQAIQHAHQKGIIHRDIKPSNILVTQHDDVAVPKVIDFGIAKATIGQLTDKTVFTAFAQFMGTPAYMSPEQAQMSGLDIDTRADIYSLGVLLYELLTGNTPFDAKELLAAGMDEMRRKIREDEPARPSTCLSTMQAMDLTTVARRRHVEPPRLIHLIRGDLDWLVMKCLEKDRTRRYETANALAMDLQRHLNDEPVVACPPSRSYRFQKLVRRNKLAFAAGVAVATALVLGMVGSTWQAVRATRAERDQSRLREAAQQAQMIEAQQRRLASEQELLARRRFYAAQMNLAMQAWDAGQLARTLELLETQRPTVGHPDLRSFEWFHLWGLCNARLRSTLRGHTGGVNSMMFSQDGKTLASSDWTGIIRLWDVPAAREIKTLKLQAFVYAVAFTPDGKTLASGSSDHLIRLWDVPSGQLRATLSGHPDLIRSLAVSPDGKTLASGGEEGVVRLWDLVTGIEQTNLLAGEQPVISIAYSSNGTTLATCTGWGRAGDGIRLWDLTRSPAQLKTNIPGGRTLALSPDGKMLATAAWEKIELWDTDPVRLRATLRGHLPPVNALAFLPDGKSLASCAQDRTIRLWQLNSDREQDSTGQVVGAHLDPASCLAVFKDGTMLASGASDGTIKLWEIAESQEHTEARIALVFKCGTNLKAGSDLLSLLPSPVTDTVFVVTRDGAEIRDITSGQKHAVLRDAVGHGALSPDGKLLATSERAGTVKLWEVATGRVLASIQAHPKIGGFLPAISFSPDGRILATGNRSEEIVRLWDATAALKPIRAIDVVGGGVGRVEFSPDGKRLAIAVGFGEVLLIDLSTDRPEHDLILGSGMVETLATAFSPDGTLLATGGEGGTVELWDVQTGRLHAVLKGHTTSVHAIAFSPDGGTVATGGGDQTVRLWDVATGQERVTFKRHRDTVTALAFSRDGNTLLTGDSKGTVWLLRGTHTAQADEGPVLMNETGETAADYNSIAWRLATDADSQTRDGHRAVDFAEKAVAATNRKDPNILGTLAAAYAEVGQFTNAVRVQQEAIALLQDETEINDHTFRLRLYEANTPYRDHNRMAERTSALLAEGKFAEAEPPARECLALREKQIPDGWQTFNARSMLGGSLLGQKKFPEAEPLLLSAYEGMKQRIPANGKPRLKETLQRIVQLYEATGQSEKAAEWSKKLAKFDQAEAGKKTAAPKP